jgi:phosphoglucomutase
MDIYLEYGFTLNHTVNVVRPGKSGADEIKQMMVDFRGAKAPKTLGGSKVICIKDYQALTATDGEGKSVKLDMPATSNVLQWFTEDGTKVSVRPSGTEPKIKFYIEAPATMECPKCYTSATAEAMDKVKAVCKDLGI